ncbi:MAG: M14 family metallopeptidase [Candidatus Pedobacter colombiensis]|uniref:M14 family metallopeptidase n=1 Tax=Candidatus Pedobacter colombiensis TaxID=3121371 RepID=A0AAJ5W8X7_9SPHI|nr:M14 metallopeptidase family protein [Pedobacter sp.]WEK19393.1 MAG: M14 family metallopeptidase [Pedobacter sp.]
MKYFLVPFLFLLLGLNAVNAQVKSPDEFLGYALGSRFTPHEKVLDYFKYLGKMGRNVKIVSYGKSYEGKELLVGIVSAKENMDKLEQIRTNNLILSKGQKIVAKTVKQPAILWLSYNVHGNEASPTETAIKMMYVLAEAKASSIQEWLKSTVVIIDPCLNPDGRERYLSYFNSVAGTKPNPNPMAREHLEPWPGGRLNHYYFDLNRDWAWQSQIETQQRLVLYHGWMPEVHVDFHEQNYNEPYYFAPAAEPIHQDITAWQKEFQIMVGKNNAKNFDEKGWKYFTKEQFDLLYPSYGDTYPLYNGAVGMTYEQGGIGAGLSVVTIDGDTLTLKDRIDHHFTAGMATLETVSKNADRLVDEFRKYFEKAIVNPPGAFRSYVVKGQNLGKLKRLAALLKKNNVDFAFGGNAAAEGYSYETRKIEQFKVERNDLIVNLDQPGAILANVLFEPQTSVNDSNTYDITAWALPYAYGLTAYAAKELIKGKYQFIEEPSRTLANGQKPYAWLLPWNSVDDAKVLIALQKAGIKVRMAEEGFAVGGVSYPIGSLLVYRAENEKTVKELSTKISEIQKTLKSYFYAVNGGSVDKGKDFGSSVYPVLPIPKVAVVASSEASAQSLGEVWHFFEQELGYSTTMINLDDVSNLDINKVNTLIFPDGTYGDNINQKVQDWVKTGGKLILMEDAILRVAGKKPFDIQKKEYFKDEIYVDGASKYQNRKQINLSNAIPGAIFKVELDRSHPISAGLGNCYYTLKTDDRLYEFLNRGWNTGVLKSGSYVAGIAGEGVLKKLGNGMLFGVQPEGKGVIIYLGSSVLFRSFWENGKLMFVNSVFLVN